MPTTDRSILLEKVVALGKERPRYITVEKIAQETGLSVHWVTSCLANRVPNPSAIRLEKLYAYLAGKPIQL